MDIVAAPEFLADVSRKAGQFQQALEGLVASHPDVFESVRGTGLMLGLKCKAANMNVLQAAYDAELITVPAADNVIRLLPPLNISDDDINEAITRLDAAAKAVAQNLQG